MRTRTTMVLSLLVAMIVFAAACSSDASDDESSAPVPDPRPEVTVVANVYRVYDGYVFAVDDTAGRLLIVVAARRVAVLPRRYSITGHLKSCVAAVAGSGSRLPGDVVADLADHRPCLLALAVRRA